MSGIYFHSPHGDAAVRGTERYFMGGFIGSLFEVSLGLRMDDDTPRSPSIYRNLLVSDHYLHNIHGRQFSESLKCALSVMTSAVFQVEGTPVNLFSAQLNTALNVAELCALGRLVDDVPCRFTIERPAPVSSTVSAAKNIFPLMATKGVQFFPERRGN